MPLPTALRSAAVLTLLLFAGGCGYALVGLGTNVPDDVRSVYVAPFENRTPRGQADVFLTRAIADEMVTRQRFSVVSNQADADAVVSGAVNAFGVTPVAFDNLGRATEYEISITAEVLFQRVPSEEVLWSNQQYFFRQSYPVEVSETEYFDLEDLALQEAAERFAETMVADLLEGF